MVRWCLRVVVKGGLGWLRVVWWWFRVAWWWFKVVWGG